jgi:Uma2 family endonuclease
MAAIAQPVAPLTPEDVDAMRDGGSLYDLVDGKLEKRTMSIAAGRVVTRAGFLLHAWLDEHPIADVIDAETTFACFPDDSRRARRGDVVVMLTERLTEEMLTGVVRVPPDLVLEVISPDDVFRVVLGKVAEWRAAGTQIVWLIEPATRRAMVFADTGDRILGEDDLLDGGNVLPGFARPLRDFLIVRGPAVPVPMPTDV